MINIPVLRWGKPYPSLETETIVHFDTGEELAKVSQANPGIIQRDMRQASRARAVLREIPISNLIAMMKKAAELYKSAELPLGDGSQTPEQFVRCQSATDRPPRAHVSCQHGEELLRPHAYGRDTRCLDARSGSFHPSPGTWHGISRRNR